MHGKRALPGKRKAVTKLTCFLWTLLKECLLCVKITFSELFSSGVTCVVFKLPSLLKTRNFKLICFALLSFVLRKYYRQKIPKLLDSFLNKQKEKDLFFIGGSVGAELIKFHYAKKNDVVVEGVETINLIAKSNKALNRLISQVKPKEVKKRIFIVGLFSV